MPHAFASTRYSPTRVCLARVLRAGRIGGLLLPLGYATAVGLLLLAVSQRPTPLPAWTRHDLGPSAPLVPTPGLSEASQRSATAVSAVDLQGFQPIDNPRIHVNRSTP